MKAFNWWIVTSILTLSLVAGLAVGYYDLFKRYQDFQSYEIKVLTENENLAPLILLNKISKKIPVKFKVIAVKDPDQFNEQAAQADLLWARRDWITNTELKLQSFFESTNVKNIIDSQIASDFLNSLNQSEHKYEELPYQWTVPLILVSKKYSKEQIQNLNLNTQAGSSEWPYWGLQDFLLREKLNYTSDNAGDFFWKIVPASSWDANHESDWLPIFSYNNLQTKLFIVDLAFVDNQKIPLNLKEQLLEILFDTEIASEFAAATNLATTIIQAEELLSPRLRASSIRQFNLDRIKK